MKKYVIVVMVAFVAFSCGKEKTVSEELVGDWLYEREVFNSFSSLEDTDTRGYITLNDDETGNWSSGIGFLDYSLEWDLQLNDEKISITKYGANSNIIFPNNRIYDLTRTDEDNFIFTFYLEFESTIDSIDNFVQFENIIISRMD